MNAFSAWALWQLLRHPFAAIGLLACTGAALLAYALWPDRKEEQ